MPIHDTTKPRGILHPQPLPDPGSFSRYLPSSGPLRFFVEHYWSIRWSVPEPLRRENLPHPSVHVVVERNRSGIFGVTSGKFVRVLEGTGSVFGIKFRPGAFHPLLRSSVSQITDTIMPLHDLFGADGIAYEEEMLSLTNDPDKIECAERFLTAHIPDHKEGNIESDTIELINTIIDRVIRQKDILRVEDISAQFSIGVRSLQRMFEMFVGVPPKWIIRRYRLFEAVDAMNSGAEADLAQLALQLGYFDQAHFINDFKAMVGVSPGDYLKNRR